MRRTIPSSLPFLILAAALGLLSGSPLKASADTLDRALLDKAPQVIKYLHEHHLQEGSCTVGVLKFLVQKGNAPAGDNAGPLNLSLADRLELALVLTASDERVRLLHDASTTAAKNRRANHRSPEGRGELFNLRYPLLWGDEDTARADAFLTGVVQLSDDLRETTVRIEAFGRRNQQPAEVITFKVATDPRTLTETGESFLARSGDAAARALRVKYDNAAHPLKADDRPIDLEILYNGKPVAIQIKDGEASCPAPATEDTAVQFRLGNRNKETYGVVLLVNGENTLYREQTLDPLLCRKWILDGGEKVTIKGYQRREEKSADQFKVLPPEESDKAAVNYGKHAGTFTLVVFRKQTQAATPPAVSRDTAVELAQSRGVMPAFPVRPQTLEALKGELTRQKDKGPSPGSRGTDNPGGLIVPGKPVANEVTKVDFDPDPIPLASATIRYYQPSGRK